MTVAESVTGARHGVSREELRRIDAYWCAANYLAVGQIYLLGNALLREPLTLEHVKPRLLGHWGTTPGLSFIYAHLGRVIRERDVDMIYVTGPGHGGPALVANAWLEGTWSERYPDVTRDATGMAKLFRQFSFPGGIPSHVAADVPGSIHEGGELGYALAHAFGAAFDNPGLIVACVIGDGEAETGALAASWHSNKFLNPATDGAVLPILHLNGYKIANPTVLARIPREELVSLLAGYGWHAHFVEGSDPDAMHARMAETLEDVFDDISAIQREARKAPQEVSRPAWPMIVLATPKGWTGPARVDGKKVEGHWRSHQVPFSELAEKPEHLRLLEKWMLSYEPCALFDANGAPRAEILEAAPRGARRMSASPHANGGELSRDLRLPPPADFAVDVPHPGSTRAEATRVLGGYLRSVLELNAEHRNFLVMGPDETSSNRLDKVFEVTGRRWLDAIDADDTSLSRDGRVLEILSEHLCQGWLEGYLLTGRHGFFSCYEAFIHIVDSMFNQHAKWLKSSRDIAWRRPIASLNILLTSHVWRQDHNGFSHQDPGFLDLVANKGDLVRVYLAPDANTLLWVTDKCLRSRNLVNAIVAGKQPQAQWLDMAAAKEHVDAGAGVFEWASTDSGRGPHVVLACAGDVPTLETLAAADLLRRHAPDVRVRVVNVVDLMTLQPHHEHPCGFDDARFDALFTVDKPIIFAFHGYPWLIHRLAYRRRNHPNLHVRGYKEKGTTTTPFDMVVLNDLDRFHLVMDVIDRCPGLDRRYAHLRAEMVRKRQEHREYVTRRGEDMPEVLDWHWQHELNESSSV